MWKDGNYHCSLSPGIYKVLGFLEFLIVIVKTEILKRLEVADTMLPILSHEVVDEHEVLFCHVKDTIKILTDSALSVTLGDDGYASAE